MEISEEIKGLYDYVESWRQANRGRLTAPQAGDVLDRLFFIHRRLVVDEYRPPAVATNKPKGEVAMIINLDPVLLAQGGTIKTYRRPSFLKRLFNRRLT